MSLCHPCSLSAALLIGGLTLSSCQKEEEKQTREAPLPSSVATTRPSAEKSRFVGHLDPSISVTRRVHLLRAVTIDSLTPADEEYLFELLARRETVEDSQAWATVANEIMTLMVRLQLQPDRFVSTLTGMLQDPEMAPVMRDYALQFLAIWSKDPAMVSTPVDPDPARRQRSWQLITAAVSDPQLRGTTIPSTALRLIAYEAQDLRGAGKVEASAAMLTPDLASWLERNTRNDHPSNQHLRHRSIEAAGLFRHQPLYAEIKSLAQADTGMSDLRLTALASLSNYQKEENVPFFESLASSDSPLRFAAQQALKRHRFSF